MDILNTLGGYNVYGCHCQQIPQVIYLMGRKPSSPDCDGMLMALRWHRPLTALDIYKCQLSCFLFKSRPIMVSPATLRYRTGCLVVNQAKPQNINICFSVYTLVTTKGCRRVGLQNWTDSHIVVCTWEPWLTAVLGPYIITQSNAVVSILSS